MSTVSGIFITNTSFTGKYTIPRGVQGTDALIQSYIDEWERKYIMKLLGVELGKLLIAYHGSSDPPTHRYDDLIAPFDLQNTSNVSFPFTPFAQIYSSLGIADFLTAMVYYHYVSETQVKNSQSGMTIPDVETAKVLLPLGAAKVAEGRFNNALETAQAIQWFCQWKTDDITGEFVYPEFAGQYIAPQYGSII